MASDNHTSFNLSGINVGHIADIGMFALPPVKPPKVSMLMDEKGFIQHIMRRSMHFIFKKMASRAVIAPEGLLMDLANLHNDKTGKSLLDYTHVWVKYLSDEMDREDIINNDIAVMRMLTRDKK
jgi:hypothetical protein